MTGAQAAQAVQSWPAAIVAASVLLGAVLMIWRNLKLPDLLAAIRDFLRDWRGEEARPGVPPRPSFPERMANVEAQTERVDRRTEELNHDMRGELTSRLVLLDDRVAGVARSQHDNAGALVRLEDRVSDHRRRNDEQIALLQRAIDDIRRRGLQRRSSDPDDPADPDRNQP